MLEAALKVLGRVLDALKLAAAALFIRRSTKIEVSRDALQHKSDIQKNQLEIAARPDADPDALRQRMRDGQL